MNKSKVLKTYSLRLKRDNTARVFKQMTTISVGSSEDDLLEMDVPCYEIWWGGSLIYSITDVIGEAKARALGLADGINHYHVFCKSKTWPIQEGM